MKMLYAAWILVQVNWLYAWPNPTGQMHKVKQIDIDKAYADGLF